MAPIRCNDALRRRLDDVERLCGDEFPEAAVALFRDLISEIEDLQRQVGNLVATRPRTIHEDPPQIWPSQVWP